jgi:hypothetical protein
MIPNIIHFVYGLKPQTEPLLFIEMCAILTAKAVHKPKLILLHYHYEPFGRYWDIAKQFVKMNKVTLPEFIGDKPIKQFQHKADIVRLQALKEFGGVYLDIDTISVSPFGEMYNHKFVMGLQNPYHLCNAVMLSEKNAEFIDIWLRYYEQAFIPDGWVEASLVLPTKLSQLVPHLITLVQQDYFFTPACDSCLEFFENKLLPHNVKATSLHLWNTMFGPGVKYFNMSYITQNSLCLYRRFLNIALSRDPEISLIFDPLILEVNSLSIKSSCYHRYIDNESPTKFNDLITFFNNEISKDEVLTVFDIGCGKFSWQTRLNNIKYIGIDIIDYFYDYNRNAIKSLEQRDNITLLWGNIFDVEIPFCDVIIMADFLGMLMNQEIDTLFKKLENKWKYLLVFNTDHTNLNSGSFYRQVDIDKAPFNKQPYKVSGNCYLFEHSQFYNKLEPKKD